MQIFQHTLRGYGEARDCSGGKIGRQCRLGLGPAIDAFVGCTGHGHTDTARELGHEYANQRKARRRLIELLIIRRLRHREPDGGDNFTLVQNRREQPVEEIVSGDLALVGDDRRTRCQSRRRIIRRGVVVGKRTPKGSAAAHRRIADGTRQPGKCRIDIGICGHRRMGGGTADGDNPAGLADTRHFGNADQAHQFGRCCKALLERRDQRLPAAQCLGVFGPESGHCIGDRTGAFYFEIVHWVTPVLSP